MKLRLLPLLLFPFATAHGDEFGSDANSFTMDFVTIGNAGNPDDDTGYGSVGYTYRIGVYEVSRGMIDAYNALAPGHGGPTLTMSDMTPHGGNGVNRPATGVSWNEAARFVNWLNTSSGHSAAYKFTTGGFNDRIALWTNLDPGYDAANPFRNANAHYFLPSEDEWYKAAYYDPNKSGGAGYWNYATGSDTAPVTTSGGTMTGTAVYIDDVNPFPTSPADITNAGGLSAYGTMAQNGNVEEWGESGSTAPNDSAGESRVYRGGYWRSGFGTLDGENLESSSGRNSNGTTAEGFALGFRVAAVPEPSGVLLTFMGMMGVALRRKR